MKPTLHRCIRINLWLYAAAIAFLLIAAVVRCQGAIDIHLRDTYFIFRRSYLFVGLALILCVPALLYALDATHYRLHLWSNFRMNTTFNFYASLWARWIMLDIQDNILQVEKGRAEAGQQLE